MSKQHYITRYSLIIRRLERGPATFEQLARFLETESDLQDKNFVISKRTLQRDIQDIREQFQYEIVNEKKGELRYYIKNRPETQEHSHRLLESYQIINAVNASQEFADIVLLETRKPKGLEHFYGLLYAIRNKRIVNFMHYKYWDATNTNRTVHPLGLKESQGRWYLIAVDTKDEKLKTFGLDRMEQVDVSKTRYRASYNYNLRELFANSFGVLRPEDEQPQLIQLKFMYEQGQYVKSYPLHHSQKVVHENNREVVLELCLCVSYDLIKELLSYGEELEVLSPVQLRKEIQASLMKTIKLYR
ncbi:MAG: helix-turn-helix transcriptional regulator [Lacibacter sp.]